jgi:hypothetical protein
VTGLLCCLVACCMRAAVDSSRYSWQYLSSLEILFSGGILQAFAGCQHAKVADCACLSALPDLTCRRCVAPNSRMLSLFAPVLGYSLIQLQTKVVMRIACALQCCCPWQSQQQTMGTMLFPGRTWMHAVHGR